MGKLKLIIFDVDGTIADTEKYGHLPACNDAMNLIGLNIKWSWDNFKSMLHIPGSSNRLRMELSKRNFEKEIIENYIGKFEPLKRKLYIEKYLPQIELRSGIIELITEAINDKIKLAIVSTSYEEQIKALLKTKLKKFAEHFEVILGKESGQKINNNGYLHKKCLRLASCLPGESLMIEDSDDGLKASICAGIPTAVFYNDYTFGSPFEKALLVAPSLEDFNLRQLKRIFSHRVTK